MSAPADALWCVTLNDGSRTLILYIPSCPSALIARWLAILQVWSLASAGAAIDLISLRVVSVERVDGPAPE